VDFAECYTTRSGKTYTIRLSYNEKIRDRDPAGAFIRSITVTDQARQPAPLPVTASRFSTFEDFTSFGAYNAINYQGVREVAIEGLRAKILTRIEDQLESLG
jgi:hypothetical protein